MSRVDRLGVVAGIVRSDAEALWGARTLPRGLTGAFMRWGWYWLSELPSTVRR